MGYAPMEDVAGADVTEADVTGPDVTGPDVTGPDVPGPDVTATGSASARGSLGATAVNAGAASGAFWHAPEAATPNAHNTSLRLRTMSP